MQKPRPRLRHASPRENCELCVRPLPDDALLELWHANRLPIKRRRPLIAETIERHGLPITVEEALKHARDHRAPQPAPTSRQVEEIFDEFHAWVMRKPRRLAVLCFVAQAKMATPAQVAELFFAEAKAKAREDLARQLLLTMAHFNGLYGVRFDGWRVSRREVPVVYALGRTGAELLSMLTETPWDWAAEPAAISPLRVVHDIGVGDYAIALRKSCGEVEIGGRRLRTGFALENFWAAQLGVGITVPAHLDELKRQQPSKVKQVVPDGFMTVGVELLDGGEQGVAPSFALPFVVERDRGRRDLPQAREQVILNTIASASGAWLERFPELKAVKGLRPPLLFVIEPKVQGDLRKGSDSTARLMNVKSGVEELAAARIVAGGGKPRSLAQLFKAGPACLFARDTDIRELGLRAPVVPLFSKVEQIEDGPTLLEALIAASRPIVASGAIAADRILELDPQGARWDWSPRKRKKTVDGEAPAEPLGGREQRRIGESPAERKAAEAELRQREADRKAYEAEVQAAREELDRG